METNVLLPLIGVGIVVVTAGLGVLWRVVATRRRRDWTQTTGTIVGSRVEVSTSSNGVSGTSKAFVIEWRAADGVTRRYVETFSMTRLRVPVGRQVRLFVDPRNPERATRALVAPGVLLGVVGALIGVAFTAISVVATR